MWGLLLVGLLVEILIKLYDLLIVLWPFLAVGLALVLLWLWVLVPLLEYRAFEARDRLRHERAQREISTIERGAIRAMFDAAQRADVIDGTATEVERR
jgi:hypothetical protein